MRNAWMALFVAFAIGIMLGFVGGVKAANVLTDVNENLAAEIALEHQ